MTPGWYRPPGRDPVPWQVRGVVTPGWDGTPGRDPAPWQARGGVTPGWDGAAGRDPHPWQARLVATLGGYGALGRDPHPWQARGVVTPGGYGAPGRDPADRAGQLETRPHPHLSLPATTGSLRAERSPSPASASTDWIDWESFFTACYSTKSSRSRWSGAWGCSALLPMALHNLALEQLMY